MIKIDRNMIIVGISILLSIVLLIGLCFTINIISDDNHGLDTSDSVVHTFIKALSKNDDARLSKCLLKGTRDSGFLLDTMSISPIVDLRTKFPDVDISNVVINSVEDLSDRLDKLSGGYYSVYSKDESFSDARRYIVTADMVCTSDTDKMESGLKFNIITVKRNGNNKWYVYTGQQLMEDLERTDADLINIVDKTMPKNTELNDSDIPVDANTYDIMYTEIESVVHDVKKLKFYSEAYNDLAKGKISIDSFEYFMPISYQSIVNFINICDDKVSDEDAIIAPNSIVKHVPVMFTNVIYSKTGLSVNIGNPTNSPIDIYGGTITGLYLAKPDQDIYDYPDVYLPGNVTFGTSYDDVVKMYGGLDAYHNDNSDLKLYSNRVKIYQKDLNNERNHVYFEFENNELVAIQYYYFDLTA